MYKFWTRTEENERYLVLLIFCILLLFLLGVGKLINLDLLFKHSSHNYHSYISNFCYHDFYPRDNCIDFSFKKLCFLRIFSFIENIEFIFLCVSSLLLFTYKNMIRKLVIGEIIILLITEYYIRAFIITSINIKHNYFYYFTWIMEFYSSVPLAQLILLNTEKLKRIFQK